MACERERESIPCISSMTCPKCLLKQFDPSYELKISHRCCHELKKKPAKNYEKQSGRTIAITGMRKDEGGNRSFIKGCVLTDSKGKVIRFHPLLVVRDSWENWLVSTKQIELCQLYRQPFNFKRSGCKGCPYSLDLQEQLETMELYLPNERKQCEIIWKPVYDEYRRLNYRLKNVEKIKLF